MLYHVHIPVHVLRDKFKGKYFPGLDTLYKERRLYLSSSCEHLRAPGEWAAFRDSLYKVDWYPYIKETFDGFGNAMEYLGRYTHKIAIFNSRILSVTESTVTFSARRKKPGNPRRRITLSHENFIRRFLMHVLPPGFLKIRYYGFLNNRMKKSNLELIFHIQGRQRFKRKYEGLSTANPCSPRGESAFPSAPRAGGRRMRHAGWTHAPS